MLEGSESFLHRFQRAVVGWFRTPPPAFDPARAASSLEEAQLRFQCSRWARYPRLDAEHRSRTCSVPDWFPDWHLVAPEDVQELSRASTHPTAAAGMFSMHPSGYLREAAVAVLAESNDVQAIPFLLIRLGDWVTQVRSAVENAVERRIERAGLIDFLPGVVLLENQARDSTRARDFAQRLLKRLAFEVELHVLLDGLQAPDLDLRRGCADLLVTRGAAADGLERALAQSDSVTKLKLGAAVLREREVSQAALDSLWSSDHPGLRAMALHRMQIDGSTRALQLSQHALFDRSNRIRAVAQRYLAAQGDDPRQRYLDQLAIHAIAPLGLAETGTVADAELVRPLLEHPRPRFRVSALGALFRWLGEAVEPLTLRAVEDPSGAVRRSAWRTLAMLRLGAETLEALWRRACTSRDPLERRRSFQLFARQPRWRSLQLACRAVAHDDVQVQSLGLELFKLTLSKWNRSWDVPTPEQRADITSLESIFRARAPASDARELRSLLTHAP